MNLTHLVIGTLFILGSGLFGSAMDNMWNVKSRPLYWGLGAASGVIATLIMVTP